MDNNFKLRYRKNLELMEDSLSQLIYSSQVNYQLSKDYTNIGKMLLSIWYDHRETIQSDGLRQAFLYNLPNIKNMIPSSRFYVDNGTMFFDTEIITLHNHEVFCDCGALDMGTSIEFIFIVNNKYKKIYAFEPDPICYEICKNNISLFCKGENHRISLYDFGLDEINGSRPFQINKSLGNSNIVNNSINSIKVRKLDSIPECKDITFFKIHTEGSELSVLKGSSELIRKTKPTIAVSIYHNLEELLTIPCLLKELVPEYNLYMRHYSTGVSESVLYAVL